MFAKNGISGGVRGPFYEPILKNSAGDLGGGGGGGVIGKIPSMERYGYFLELHNVNTFSTNVINPPTINVIKFQGTINPNLSEIKGSQRSI